MGCVSTALTDLGSGNRRSHIPAPVQPTNRPNLGPWVQCIAGRPAGVRGLFDDSAKRKAGPVIIAQEPSLRVGILWSVACTLLGSPFCCAWVCLRLLSETGPFDRLHRYS